jgi:hypothetical protein
MPEKIDLDPQGVTQVAQSIAAALTSAAQPGPAPVATGASPIDAAAASVAGEVAAKVAASAADLAPRSADGLAKAQAAMAEAQAQDEKNAARINEVPADMVQGNPPTGSGAPLRPAGAGPGVIPGTGRPAESISNAGDPYEDWENFRDGSEPVVPSGPAGAGPGTGVIPGTGVPPSLI